MNHGAWTEGFAVFSVQARTIDLIILNEKLQLLI